MNNMLALGREKVNKCGEIAEKIIFPLILLLYPLILVNQGIDITDTTYSLGYYRFMEQMDITWVLATYLANVAGALLMKLPLGNTLLGMNVYTGLIVSMLVLICYYTLRKWMPAWIVFLGEVIAIGLCWCPTTILYNYLTYFLFTLGCILLYMGIIQEKKRYYILAGICLGLNVMVRFSNLPEAALIAALWFAGWLNKDKVSQVIKKTGYCLAGYAAGIGSILLVIIIKYGFSSFTGMISGLFGMTQEASDYTLGGMLAAIGSAYFTGFKWMIYMIPCALAGMIMFLIKKGEWEKLKKTLFCIGILILLRFYWGQGMFSFRYYNEGSVFQWMMLFLIVAVICCIVELGGYLSGNRKERILAAIILIVILITPIGSNNYTYQNMNNMFLVAPYTLWVCYRLWLKTKGRAIHFPWQAFMAAIIFMVLVQGTGFGCVNVFRDGIRGEKRDTQVENSPVLQGMYTTGENAGSLSELIAYCNEKKCTEEPVLIWGDAPGLSYILDVPSAIFTTWPEIPSNTYEELDKALEELTWEPVIILHNDTGKEITEGDKTDLILDFIAAHKYDNIFENSNYKVYQVAE